MATSIDSIHRDILELKKDVEVIKDILKEDFELSDTAKKRLAQARNTPESEYIALE
ncbi:MAG: hypothetical protein V1837_04750 [Candidatus Woesearchaeota archaeon]